MTVMRVDRLFAAAAVILFVGCATSKTAQFGPSGYVHRTYSYTVRYAEGSQVLPTGWRLDNYFANAQGLYPRTDPGYTIGVQLDRNDDRVADGVVSVPTYDLRFIHEQHPGVIWLRTFPYSYHYHEHSLDQLTEDYLPYLAAQGPEAAVIEDRQPGAPRVSVVVRDRASWMVAGHPAVALDIELNPLAGAAEPARRARLVLVQPGFMHQVTRSRQSVLYPVLLVVGYSNAPEAFDAGLPAFEGLLQQIVVQGVSGVTKITDFGPASSSPPGADPAQAPSATPRAPAGAAGPAAVPSVAAAASASGAAASASTPAPAPLLLAPTDAEDESPPVSGATSP